LHEWAVRHPTAEADLPALADLIPEAALAALPAAEVAPAVDQILIQIQVLEPADEVLLR
jgi:hypothetical protein